MTYLIRYKQKFMGEMLTDEYVRYIEHESELIEIQENLYSDPNVYSVECIKMQGGETEK